MIEHIILFRADGLSDSQAADFLAKIEQLTKLPQVRTGTCGRNFSSRSKGFDYCLRLTFENETMLSSYESCQEHREFVAQRKLIASDLICVDFQASD